MKGVPKSPPGAVEFPIRVRVCPIHFLSTRAHRKGHGSRNASEGGRDQGLTCGDGRGQAARADRGHRRIGRGPGDQPGYIMARPVRIGARGDKLLGGAYRDSRIKRGYRYGR